MEYGLIFHGTRTVKYYCKYMKYRIISIIQLLYSRTYLNVSVNLLHSQSDHTVEPLLSGQRGTNNFSFNLVPYFLLSSRHIYTS